MNRRGFLAGCLALGAAPAIVRAESLMRISSNRLDPSRWSVGETLIVPLNNLLSPALANGYVSGEIAPGSIISFQGFDFGRDTFKVMLVSSDTLEIA